MTPRKCPAIIARQAPQQPRAAAALLMETILPLQRRPLGKLPEEEELVLDLGGRVFGAEAQAGHGLRGESTGRWKDCVCGCRAGVALGVGAGTGCEGVWPRREGPHRQRAGGQERGRERAAPVADRLQLRGRRPSLRGQDTDLGSCHLQPLPGAPEVWVLAVESNPERNTLYPPIK